MMVASRCIRLFSPRRCAILFSIVLILSFLSLTLTSWILKELNHMTEVGKLKTESAEAFLSRYTHYCENNFGNHEQKTLVNRILRSTVGIVNATTSHTLALHSCDCVPKTIIGRFNIKDLININRTWNRDRAEFQQEPVLSGGRWEPKLCAARQNVAIIIPYRDRASHLQRLLSVLHPLLQRQRLHYTVFVVEQLSPTVFNKAMLMNAAFREASLTERFDCYIFHDVDMLPEDDRNFYTCSASPRHMGAFVDKFSYNLPYFGIFGGATAFTRQQFERINGFSNRFYGWGGEDDDIYMRVSFNGMHVERYPRSVARYSMIEHDADSRNPYNTQAYMGTRFLSADLYKHDGLSSLNYSREGKEPLQLYTWIKVRLPEPPIEYRTFDRTSVPFINICSIGLLLVFILVGVSIHHYATSSDSRLSDMKV